MDKTPITASTHFNSPPVLKGQLLGISDDCLMLQHLGIKRGLNVAFGWAFSFLFIGIPASILPFWSSFYGSFYGYNGDGSIATFADVVADLDFYILILGGVGLGLYLWFIPLLLVRTTISKNSSPIIFNRQTQTISAVFHKKETTISFSEIKASFYTQTKLGSGLIPMNYEALKEALEGVEALEEVLEIEGLGRLEGNESLWEFIRIFMQEGADNLKITPYCYRLAKKNYIQNEYNGKVILLFLPSDTHL